MCGWQRGRRVSLSHALAVMAFWVAPSTFLVLNPLGTRNRIKRLHCRYCDMKSAYSCACSPFVSEGMNPRDAMAIWRDRQEGRCMLRHIAREASPRKRMKASRKEWTSKTPSSAKKLLRMALKKAEGMRRDCRMLCPPLEKLPNVVIP